MWHPFGAIKYTSAFLIKSCQKNKSSNTIKEKNQDKLLSLLSQKLKKECVRWKQCDQNCDNQKSFFVDKMSVALAAPLMTTSNIPTPTPSLQTLQSVSTETLVDTSHCNRCKNWWDFLKKMFYLICTIWLRMYNVVSWLTNFKKIFMICFYLKKSVQIFKKTYNFEWASLSLYLTHGLFL